MNEGDHVHRIGQDQPVGGIEKLVTSAARPYAVVRWGVQDGKAYTDRIPLDQLEVVDHIVLSPDEVIERAVLEAGGKRIDDLPEFGGTLSPIT